MAERIGMNTSDVQAHARALHGYTGQLDSVATQVDATAENSRRRLIAASATAIIVPLPWVRSAAAGAAVLSWASMEISKNAANDIRSATASAQELLGRLGVNISEQIDASSATEGYLDGLMSRSRAEDLYRRAMNDPSVLADLSPMQVSGWWDRLSKAEQDAFISAHHWVAGNTNGIPFERRIQANQLSAAELLSNGGIDPTSNEYSYLVDVANGDRTLISFDPQNDRIIEMIGELNERTQDIVSYVPGTTSDMQGFYDGDTQQIGQHLVDNASPPGATVAFIFKDAEFPTFGADGVYHASWAASVGDPYHRFQQALGLENTGGVPVTSIEHSFGSSVGGYAEIQGTQFDTRIVLAGIGMTDEWKPVEGTNYYSLTGSNDIIRAARDRYSEDLNTGYEHSPTTKNGFYELDPKLPAWNPGAYAGPIIGVPVINPGMDPIEQHTTIATAGPDNAVALEHLIEIIRK
jgi:hypothetical protein